jgi:serine/threonine protein kinase
MLQGPLHDDTSDEVEDSWDAATNQVHWPIGGVLNSEYAPALRALGLIDPAEQKLGRGGFGYAYKVKLHETSVLKLTRDPMEVLASWALRGRATEHVVTVYEVWSLPKMHRFEHWASWWVIHRAYLLDFNKKDGDLLETIFDLWKDDDLDLSLPKVGAAGRGMREKWRQVLRHETSCNQMEAQRCLILLDQTCKGIREMGQVGIDWTDILPDNLLRDRQGNLRIADVGFGLAKHDIECEPPELTVELAREYASAPWARRQAIQR